MKYIITSFYDDAEVTVKTNDPEVAVLEIMQKDMEGVHAHACNGETGEVLALVNHPDQFSTDEFSLMILGVLMKHSMEQAEAEEAECVECEPEPEIEREVIPTIFEVMSALCGQLEVDMGLSHEDALGFPFIVPTPNESEIVS